MSQVDRAGGRESVGRPSARVRVGRGMGWAAAPLMLGTGGAALLGAGLLVQWARGQEALGAVLGVIMVVVAGVPLGLMGLVLLGAGLREIGALRGDGLPHPGGGPARGSLGSSLGRVVLLLGVVGVVVWAVLFDRMATAVWAIGAVLAVLVLLEVLRSGVGGFLGARRT